MDMISEHKITITQLYAEWAREHVYGVSFFISLGIILFMLFYTPSIEIVDHEFEQNDSLQFVNIETIPSPRRVVKKKLSADVTDTSEENTEVERAQGTSDDAQAVDLAFYPNIAHPRPVARLKKLYPKSAREQNIEAIVQVELFIAMDGIVKGVKILGIRLTKALPTEIHARISEAFARDTLKILKGAQFSPPVVNGKRVAIKMEMPLKFRLN